MNKDIKEIETNQTKDQSFNGQAPNVLEKYWLQAFVVLVLDKLVPLNTYQKNPIHFRIEEYLAGACNEYIIKKDNELSSIVNTLDRFISDKTNKNRVRDYDIKYVERISLSLREFIFDPTNKSQSIEEFNKYKERKLSLFEDSIKNSEMQKDGIDNKVLKEAIMESIYLNLNESLYIGSINECSYLSYLLNDSCSRLYYHDLNKPENLNSIKTEICAYLIKKYKNIEIKLCFEDKPKAAIIFLEKLSDESGIHEINRYNGMLDTIERGDNGFISNGDNKVFDQILFIVPSKEVAPKITPKATKEPSKLFKKYAQLGMIESVCQLGSYVLVAVGNYHYDCIYMRDLNAGRDDRVPYDYLKYNNYSLRPDDWLNPNYGVDVRKLERNLISNDEISLNDDGPHYCRLPDDDQFKKEERGLITKTIEEFIQPNKNEDQKIVFRGYQANEETELGGTGFVYHSYRPGFENNAAIKYLKPEAITELGYILLNKTNNLYPKATVIKERGIKDKDNNVSKAMPSTIEKLSLKPWDIIISTKLWPMKATIIPESVLNDFKEGNGKLLIPSANMIVIRCGDRDKAFYLKMYLESKRFAELLKDIYKDNLQKSVVTVKDFMKLPISYIGEEIENITRSYRHKYETMMSHLKQVYLAKGTQENSIEDYFKKF